MNLKRLRGIAAVAFTTIAAAMIAGCMNPMAGSVNGGTGEGQAVLQLAVTGVPNEYAKQFEQSYPNAGRNASGRSITPQNPYTPGDTTLKFYLSGTSTTGKKLAPTSVTLKLKDGETNVYVFDGKVTLLALIWDLDLTAYTDYPTKPVLLGHSWVDLRNGSGSIEFVMGTEGLDTAGDVKITGKFKSNDNVGSYTIGIYKKDSPSEAVDKKEVDSVTPDAGGLVDFEYNETGVDPGNYFFRIITKNDGGTITGSYIDTLIVDPGHALDRDLGTLDFVNKKPEPPTDFTASLENDSEKPNGTYLVKLGWAGGGGETNFEVELTEYADDGTDATTATKKIYGIPAMADATETIKHFKSSDVWGKGGAMTYGDTEAYFKLKLGVVYEVRIRARNSVGVSPWVDREALATADTGFTPYGSEKINRMKIEYDLNGGVLELYNSGSNNHKQIPELYTEYKTWKGTDLPLLAIDNVATNANRLKKGSTPFKEWQNTDGTAVEDSSYENLSVKASYDPSLNGTIAMKPRPEDVNRTHITVTYGKTGSLTDNAVNVTTPGTYDIPRMVGSDSMFLRIVLDATQGYKDIKFKLSRTEGTNVIMTEIPYEDNNKNSCVIPLDEYEGIFTVLVMADTGDDMSQTLVFRVK